MKSQCPITPSALVAVAGVLASILLAPLAAPAALAQEKKHDHAGLATQATNPAAALIQLQLQNIFIPESHNSSGYANTFIIQPVVPVGLGKDSYFQNIIFRGTLPVVATPDPDGPVDSTTDLGDLTTIAVLAHKQKVSDTFGFEWGPVAGIALPTATDNRTGTGKVSVGPGLLAIGARKNLFEKGDTLQFGAYGYNLYSVAGEGNRNNVNELFFGPIMTYHFADLFEQPGWYVRWTDELMSFAWENDSSEVASVPVGAALGKVTTLFGMPLNIFLASDYYAAHRGTDAVWDIKLNVTFLFPE